MTKLASLIVSLLITTFGYTAHADDHAEAEMPVGVVYSLDVHDAQAFVGSMTKYWDSKTGDKNPGYAILRQVISGGESSASHTVAVVYPSYAAWDKANVINANSKDAATFGAEIQESVSLVSSSMFEFTGVTAGTGRVDAGSAITMYYQLSVSDPATYVSALKRYDASQPSANQLGLFQIAGNGDSDITHVIAISANSIADLMGNLKKDQSGKAFESFLNTISPIRSVEGTFVTADIAVFGN